MRPPLLVLFLAMFASTAARSDAAEDLLIDSRLKRVTEKFEAEVERLHDGVESDFKKLLQEALRTGNQQQNSLLRLQHAAFKRYRTLPPWMSTRVRRAYEAKLQKSCSTLINAWEKVIAGERAGQNLGTALTLEKSLGDLLADARGFGLALPPRDILAANKFRLRNAATGTVMDLNAANRVIVRPVSQSRREQVLEVVLFEDTLAIRNTRIGKCFNIPNSTDTPDTQLMLWSRDGSGANEKWHFREDGRRIVIESNLNGLVLGTQPSGTGNVVQQKNEDKLTQRWVIELSRK